MATAAISIERIEPGHLYKVNGIIRPSVTQVMRDVRIIDYDVVPTEVGEIAMERGTIVHQACELFDREELDEDSIDPVVRPYIDAYMEWKGKTGFTCSFIEHMFYHELGYCGTMDRTGDFPDNTKAVLDLKTGEALVKRPVGVQLAAYAAKLGAPLTYRRIALRLSRKGKFQATEFAPKTYFEDWAAFQSALNVYNWKRR